MVDGAPVLVIGGTGKTGRRIVERLRARGLHPRVATRNPEKSGEVRFEWNDGETFAASLDGVGAIYLVAPTDRIDSLAAMQPFIDQALYAGVERFVLLSASSLRAGGPMMGAVHAYLVEHAPQWVVLRPTWFMQNFSEQQHLPTIREHGVIESATGDGRVAFIDAEDIAAVAVEALVRSDLSGREFILTGPAALSYDDVAALISEVSGRSVEHRRFTEAALALRHESSGLPVDYALMLARMDTAIAEGAEDRITDAVLEVTGRQPTAFADFARRDAARWGLSSSRCCPDVTGLVTGHRVGASRDGER